MDFSVFSPDGLLAALTAHGYKVSKRTINRWKAGAQPSREDIRAIRAILFPDTEKEAASSVTKRLLAGVIALEKNARISDAERAAAMLEAEMYESLALATDARVSERLTPSPRKRSSRAADPSDERGAASPSSKRQARKPTSQP